MDSEQDLTLLDAYLNGTLSVEDRAAVDSRLASDSDFQELYEFTRSVQRAARQAERQRLRAMLQAIETKSAASESVPEPKTNVIPLNSRMQVTDRSERREFRTARATRTRRWPFTSLGIAAAVVAALLVWQPTKSSNEALFAAYADTTVSTATLAGPAEPTGPTGTRGKESALAGFTAAESEMFAQAVDKLQARDYEGAKSLLKSLLRAKGEQPELLRSLAVAQLNSNEVAEAVRHLEDLYRQPSLAARDEVAYDLALGYIRQGKPGQARPLLQALATSNTKLAGPATAILAKLRWWF